MLYATTDGIRSNRRTMTYVDIRGPIEAFHRSSSTACDAGRGMRAVDLAATDAGEDAWRCQFLPAIVDEAPGAPVREPWWYVLRYDARKEGVVRRLLDLVGQRHHSFVYQQPVARSRPVLRPWLPGGYAFVEFDAARDRWQQIYRFPGVLGVLGGPTPLPASGAGSFDDLVLRCPLKLPKPDALSALPPGTRVRVSAGPFAGQEGVVNRSTRAEAWFVAPLFGRFIEVRVALRDVKVVA